MQIYKQNLKTKKNFNYLNNSLFDKKIKNKNCLFDKKHRDQTYKYLLIRVLHFYKTLNLTRKILNPTNILTKKIDINQLFHKNKYTNVSFFLF